MAKELNYSKMGVSEKTLKNASIRNIKENSFLHNFTNEQIVEDRLDGIKVVKEESGRNRPYLVLYNNILHASTAMYMTSSLPDDRIDAENRIWGTHLIRTPKNLYNYIGISAVKGKLEDKSRVSVIDRDRFLFVTDDSLAEITTQATDAAELNWSLTSHYTNVDKIVSSLETDFPADYVKKIVMEGVPQRWVYLIHDRKPVLYSPSAMYLYLYINAGLQFENKTLKLTPEDLKMRSETLMGAVRGYKAYEDFHKKLTSLQEKDPSMYLAYKNARYYNDIISERTYNKMWEEDHKKRSENAWKFVAGHPHGLYGKMEMEERLVETLLSAGFKGKRITAAAEELVKLYTEEKSVHKKVRQAVKSVIEDVQRVERENINLSAFSFNVPLVTDALKDTKKCEKFVNLKYQKMANEFEMILAKKRSLEQKRKEENKQRSMQKEYEALANEYAIMELKTTLKKRFLGLYDKSFKQYISGGLFPSSPEQAEMQDFMNVVQMPDEEDIVIGKELYNTLNKDFKSLQKFNDRISASISMINEAKEDIKELEKDIEVQKSVELLSLITNAITKEQIKKAKTGEKVKPEKVLDEILNIEENEELVKYLALDFSHGSKVDKFLSSMQAAVNGKADARNLMQAKDVRIAVLNSLIDANNKELIASYMEVEKMTQKTSGSYYTKNNIQKPKSLEEISARLDAIGEVLATQKPTKKQQDMLIQKAQEMPLVMQHTVDNFAAQRKYKAYFKGSLIKYEEDRLHKRGLIKKLIKQAHTEVIKNLKSNANFSEAKDLEKEDRLVVQDKKGREILSMTKREIDDSEKEFYKANKDCFKIETFSNPQRTEEIIYKIFDKCYPPAATLEQMADEIALKKEDPKHIANAYKEYGDLVKDQKDQMHDLLEKMGSTLLTALTINQENHLMANNFDILIDMMSLNVVSFLEEQYAAEPDAYEGEEEAVKKAIKQGTADLKQKVRQDLADYTENIYSAIEEVEDNLPERNIFTKSQEDFLRTRKGGKQQVKNRAQMPQSLSGGNGVEQVMLALQAEKRRHTMILGDLVVGTESMSDSVYQNVLSYTAGFLVKYADEAREMVQREYKQESIKNTTETIRLYALQDKANEAFVTDKDCLIKFMKLYGKVSNVKVKGGVLKRDMDAFYAEFMAALKEAIIILNSPDKRYEPVGEFDDNIDTQLNKLHNMYNNAFNNPRTKKTPPENQ